MHLNYYPILLKNFRKITNNFFLYFNIKIDNLIIKFNKHIS